MAAEVQYTPALVKLGIVGGTAFLTLGAIAASKKPSRSKRKKFDPWTAPIEATPGEAVVASTVAMGALYLATFVMRQGLEEMGYTRPQIEEMAQLGFAGSATLGLVKIAMQAKRRTT